MVFVGLGIRNISGVDIDLNQTGHNKFNVHRIGSIRPIGKIQDQFKKLHINEGSGIVVNKHNFKPLKFRK